jgi:hypothetical protein
MLIALSYLQNALRRLGDGLTRDAPAVYAYPIAVALGLVTYFLIFGWAHILGISPFWDLPHGDLAQYIIGYRYFLHQPWGWPLFHIQNINVPFGKNLLFSDAIPLFAAINKAIATMFSPWGRFTEHAYLGIWHAICYSLQAAFGVAILRALGVRSYLATICSSLFFLSLPTFIARYGHASLDAHFLILSALYLYLRTSSDSNSIKLRIVSMVQLVVASLINHYHLAISLGIFSAAVLQTRNRRAIAIWLPLGFGSALGAMWLAGFISPETMRIKLSGFDRYSANLLAPLVPVRSFLFGNWTPTITVDATDYQYEGYDYLGAGFLLLGALLFVV